MTDCTADFVAMACRAPAAAPFDWGALAQGLFAGALVWIEWGRDRREADKELRLEFRNLLFPQRTGAGALQRTKQMILSRHPRKAHVLKSAYEGLYAECLTRNLGVSCTPAEFEALT